jgi:TPR repeat protein
LLIATATQDASADTASGLEAMKRGDYIHALIELRGPAQEGDATAQVSMAAIYHYGLGVPADFSKALQWYRAAALQGNVDGQIGLAVLYAAGQGVRIDLAIARMWLSIAADALPPNKDRIRVAQDRDMLAERMSPAELRQSDDLIKNWYSHHKAP